MAPETTGLRARSGAAMITWRTSGLILGVGLWAVSIPQTNIEAMGQLGLIDALPITFFVAVVMLVVSFFGELFAERSSKRVLGLHLIALVVVVHATAPLLFPEPRYAWSYKHFGVTEHISIERYVSPTVDVYQNWPGFFALTSWFGEAAGLPNPVDYGAWSQLFFNLVYLLELAFVVRMLTKNERVLWTALMLFVCTSWVGQDYFAPQAFSYALVLAMYGLFLRWLTRSDPETGLSRLIRRVVPVRNRSPVDTIVWRSSTVQRTWAVVGAGFFFFVITMSHQLTPYIVLFAVALLTLCGAVVSRTVLLLLAAISLAYLGPHLDFVLQKYGLLSGFDPLGNVQNQTVTIGTGEQGRHFVAWCARVLSALVIGLAVVGFVRRLREGKREIVVGVLMIAPLGIVFGQSYGGEAIYRTFLFALPWACYLAAQAITPRADRVRWHIVSVAPVPVMAALLLVSYFGLEQVNRIRPGEVAAAEYFYSEAPRGSMIMTVDPNFPFRSKGNYTFYVEPDLGTITPKIKLSGVIPDDITPPDLERTLAEEIDGYDNRRFVALTAAQQANATTYGTLLPGALEELDRFLSTNAGWREFYRNDDAVIYERLAPRA